MKQTGYTLVTALCVFMVFCAFATAATAAEKQVGAFTSRDNAQKVVEKAQAEGSYAYIKEKVIAGKTLYAVIVDTEKAPKTSAAPAAAPAPTAKPAPAPAPAAAPAPAQAKPAAAPASVMQEGAQVTIPARSNGRELVTHDAITLYAYEYLDEGRTFVRLGEYKEVGPARWADNYEHNTWYRLILNDDRMAYVKKTDIFEVRDRSSQGSDKPATTISEMKDMKTSEEQKAKEQEDFKPRTGEKVLIKGMEIFDKTMQKSGEVIKKGSQSVREKASSASGGGESHIGVAGHIDAVNVSAGPLLSWRPSERLALQGHVGLGSFRTIGVRALYYYPDALAFGDPYIGAGYVNSKTDFTVAGKTFDVSAGGFSGYLGLEKPFGNNLALYVELSGSTTNFDDKTVTVGGTNYTIKVDHSRISAGAGLIYYF